MKHYPFIIFYLFLNLFIYAFQGTIWVYIFCFIFFSAVVVWGSFDIQLGYFVNSFTHKQTKIKEVALTFDDGPTEFTSQFLDLLKENNIKATFFCIGKQIEKYPETFQRIIAEGHSIGNHTFSHSNNTGFLSTSKMIDEIERCDEVMLKIGNSKTNLYRPPFGVTNPNIAKAIKKTQKQSIGWNVRSLDTVISEENKILRKVTKNLKKGSIILLHDTSEKTYNVLVELLLFLEREKYSTFTIKSEKLMFKNIAFTAFLLISSFVFAQNTAMTSAESKAFVTKISAESKQIKTLQSDFIQTKKMDFLDKNIVTSGKMSLKSPNTLSWKYTKPYQYSIIFKENKIFINDQGKKSAVDAKSKTFEKINKLIVGSSNGQMFSDPEFSVVYLKNTSSNIAKFTPKSAQLLKYIKQIELHFPKNQTTVSQVNMTEASGDTTSIIFKNTKINAPIPASEFSL